jgi:hypothetical protein
MGNPELGVLMLAVFVVFIMFGFPIAFTLMALGVGFGYLAMGDTVFSLVVQRTYSVMTNDVLVSIPLFVFMGYIIERANILDRLFLSLQLALGWVPGLARGRDARHLRHLRHRDRHRRRGRHPDGPPRLPGHAARRLRRPPLGGRGVRRRLSRHPDPALRDADPYGATAGVSVPKLYAGALFPGLMLAGST